MWVYMCICVCISVPDFDEARMKHNFMRDFSVIPSETGFRKFMCVFVRVCLFPWLDFCAPGSNEMMKEKLMMVTFFCYPI